MNVLSVIPVKTGIQKKAMDQINFDYELTLIEQKILSLLHKGRESAVKVRILSTITGMSEVEIRQTVKHLVEEHNIMIVSATSNPAGYYFPISIQESEAGAIQIEHRIISLARRLRVINRQAYERLLGQLNLFHET